MFLHGDVTSEDGQNVLEHYDPEDGIWTHVSPKPLQTRVSSPVVPDGLISSGKDPNDTSQNHEKTTEENENFCGSQIIIKASTLSVSELI